MFKVMMQFAYHTAAIGWLSLGSVSCEAAIPSFVRICASQVF